MKRKEITVLKVEPLKKPTVCKLTNELEELQKAVSIGADYCQNINEYSFCTNKSWLCKSVPNILYQSDCYDEVNLILPPADLVSTLNLKLNVVEMCWCDDNDNAIIICNNNKSSYYNDYAVGTVMIRKDILDKAKETMNIKYFVFAEKYIKEMGYSHDTPCLHHVAASLLVRRILFLKYGFTLSAAVPYPQKVVDFLGSPKVNTSSVKLTKTPS